MNNNKFDRYEWEDDFSDSNKYINNNQIKNNQTSIKKDYENKTFEISSVDYYNNRANRIDYQYEDKHAKTNTELLKKINDLSAELRNYSNITNTNEINLNQQKYNQNNKANNNYTQNTSFIGNTLSLPTIDKTNQIDSSNNLQSQQKYNNAYNKKESKNQKKQKNKKSSKKKVFWWTFGIILFLILAILITFFVLGKFDYKPFSDWLNGMGIK